MAGNFHCPVQSPYPGLKTRSPGSLVRYAGMEKCLFLPSSEKGVSGAVRQHLLPFSPFPAVFFSGTGETVVGKDGFSLPKPKLNESDGLPV